MVVAQVKLGRIVICDPVKTDGRGEAEASANARLIAEAPAMLEALRKAVEPLGWAEPGEDREYAALRAISALRSDFRAILARIDGEVDA